MKENAAVKAGDIPFVRHIGIEEEERGLSLSAAKNISNHLQTNHAGAQVTLAETQSGLYLQQLFPEMVGTVLPVLREAQIKYRQPAAEKISAIASADDEAVETFRKQFKKRGRGLLKVVVDIRDSNDMLTA